MTAELIFDETPYQELIFLERLDETPYHDLFLERLDEIRESRLLFAEQTKEWVQAQADERNTITPLLKSLIKKTGNKIGTYKRLTKVTAWDRFRKVRWTLKYPNGKPHAFMVDVIIWDQIREQTYSSLPWLYDIAYNNYLRRDITDEQWNAFENLIWNKGVPLILH